MKRNERNAIILLGHGSRRPGAQRDMEEVARSLRERHHDELVELCSLSGLGPRFGEAFKKCVSHGATRVIVIPYFLHEGQHLKVDIPTMMKEESRDFPQVTLILGKHLGFDPSLVELVRKRVEESEDLCDVRQLTLEPRESSPVAPGHDEE